ncbi:unnamed protein product [Mytilus edulis]|uniref:Uncharacterized protein n=1 Tax=Mytilus edulis TaxID=6550 RepID=A0A8S3PTD9_MYTED|nr:unnamed protein product [Mytilus edulis]
MVYEYGSDLTDNHKEALIMDTRDTPPCFTYLRISTSLYSDTEQMLQQKDGESLLSNELFKMHRLNNLASTHILRNLHGPCISDDSEQYDIAYCIKCEKWISQAQPWNAYQQDICCFTQSETLCDYSRFSYDINRPLSEKNKLIKETIEIFSSGKAKGHIYRLTNNLLHHSRSRLSRNVFSLFLSDAHHFVSGISTMELIPSNKQRYFQYKRGISHLLIGINSDAISGWLLLATFLYSHTKYHEALMITDHVMSKLTDKTIPSLVDTSHDPIIITQIQKYQMELMKQEKITTIVKHSINLDICIDRKALAVLPELKQDTTDPFTVFPSIPMAYFIRFLCYYRLDDHQSFMNAFMELLQKNIMTQFQYNIYRDLSSVNVLDLIYIPYFLGISLQMIGENDLAKQCFEITATMDYFHFTRSRSRLSELI